MPSYTFTPSILRGAGTRAVPAIPAGSSFTNTRSLSFDGSDDFILLSSAISFPLFEVFSLSAWVKPVSLSSNQGNIISSATDNSNKIGIASANQVQVKLGGSNSSINTTGGSNNFTTGAWQHILITRNSSNIITVFRNGSAYDSSVTNANSGTYNSIGKFKTTSFLNSSLDEVAIFNTDQTANVSTIYNSGVPGDLSSLSPLHWYRFEEGSGTTATDSGTGGNNGTISGATYSTSTPS